MHPKNIFCRIPIVIIKASNPYLFTFLLFIIIKTYRYPSLSPPFPYRNKHRIHHSNFIAHNRQNPHIYVVYCFFCGSLCMSFSTRSTQYVRAPAASLTPPVCAPRRDVLALKARLLATVEFDEYWPTLTKFLRGEMGKAEYDALMQRCLRNDEARALHNELIRSLIFNARFAAAPPPGMRVSAPAPPHPVAHYDRRAQRLLAADCGCVPGLPSLMLRVERALASHRMRADSGAVVCVHLSVLGLVCGVLRRSVALLRADSTADRSVTVGTEQILTVVNSNCGMRGCVCDRTFEKFMFDD